MAKKATNKGSKRKTSDPKKKTVKAQAPKKGVKEKTATTKTKERTKESAQKEKAQEAQQVPLTSLATADLLQWFVGVLATKAWQDLGLVADPVSGQAEEDIEQAELAIDVASFVSDTLSDKVDKETRREIATLVTNLRLNFVAKQEG